MKLSKNSKITTFIMLIAGVLSSKLAWAEQMLMCRCTNTYTQITIQSGGATTQSSWTTTTYIQVDPLSGCSSLDKVVNPPISFYDSYPIVYVRGQRTCEVDD